jgi:type 1 glutamine amidotransferase
LASLDGMDPAEVNCELLRQAHFWYPLVWTHEKGKGRVFVSILGHYSWTFDDPLFRVLVLRGLAWAAREPIERFTNLATVGARLGE